MRLSYGKSQLKKHKWFKLQYIYYTKKNINKWYTIISSQPELTRVDGSTLYLPQLKNHQSTEKRPELPFTTIKSFALNCILLLDQNLIQNLIYMLFNFRKGQFEAFSDIEDVFLNYVSKKHWETTWATIYQSPTEILAMWLIQIVSAWEAQSRAHQNLTSIFEIARLKFKEDSLPIM